MKKQGIETIGQNTLVIRVGTIFPKYLNLVAITAASIILAVSTARPAAAADPNSASPTTGTTNVNVVNTPTVNVGNTPTVNVGAMPAVTLNGSPTVKVGNTPANPVPSLDVEKLARIPYSSLRPINCTNGCGLSTNIYFADVPIGYRLVIEHVSAAFGVPGGITGVPSMDLYSYNQTPKGRWFFVGKPTITSGSTQGFAFNEDVLAYFDPGDQPGIDLDGIPATGTGTTGLVTASGHLENCAITLCPPIVH